MSRFAKQLECPTAEITPGESLRCRLRIYNPEEAVDEYTVVGLDEAADWVSTNPPTLTLLPETDGELQLVVAIPPDAPVPAGERHLVVRIDPSLDGVAPQTEHLVVRVAEVTAADLRVLPTPEGPGDEDVTSTVAIANTGNHPLRLSFRAIDHDHDLAVRVAPWEMVAEPFQAYTLPLTVPLASCPAHGDHTHRVEVTATADGLTRSAQISVDHAAPPPRPNGDRTVGEWLRDTVRLFVAVPVAAILVGALEVVGVIVLVGRFELRAVAVAAAASLAGAALVAYHHGALHEVRAARRNGSTVEGPVADGAVRQLAGILLLVPGFVTDAAGIVLLVPGVHRAARAKLLAT